MTKTSKNPPVEDIDPGETQEWLESLEYTVRRHGTGRLAYLLDRLHQWSRQIGVPIPFNANTPYVNTIPLTRQPPFPGNREVERRIKSCIRWNAMAMVVRANRESHGIGGHISTFASAATLLEIGFNHFFRGAAAAGGGDQIFFQGHAAPGIYARAFLEGRVSVRELENFRRELQDGGGLSSYPHPWLMPEFWEFSTVSMGLGPLLGIYQARFNRYLHDRGLKDTSQSRVWVFMGDGETDEPESLGAINLAARERLENLIFVVNCNLQRLDGPVRGNGKIIQELEAAFRGAGWNVIKVIWGGSWDPLLARDQSGLLIERMGEVVDGQYQKYSVSSGAYIREDFFGKSPQLLQLVEHLSDDQLCKMRRGGHDPDKVFAAYQAAVEHCGSPTVILAKTIKGYGLGEAGEGKNVTHQQKKLNEDELREFRTRFGIPISDEAVAEAPFYRPADDSVEMKYLEEQRRALGGYVPSRRPLAEPLSTPPISAFDEFLKGTSGRPASTTMAFVRMLSMLLRDKELGKWIVPIVPDEARTFGMEALFRQAGIYSSVGQLYDPVDSDTLLYYREARDGQILEEGITEAGSLASFVAAGTAYATHAIPTIPFFIYYSMFGFQRVGDLAWAAADMCARGFLLGGTAGRTTLAGEGLQHQDGQSHVLCLPIPTLRAYDPAFAYETAVIVQDGLRRMYADRENVFYYITLGNEPYPMPEMPAGVDEGIRRGLYRFRAGSGDTGWPSVDLWGSGALLNEVLGAQKLLADRYQVRANVWSATSYKLLAQESECAERWNRLHPEEPPRMSYLTSLLAGQKGPIVAASDYIKALPRMVAPWVSQPYYVLGTDGFGRSETRQALRKFFEVDVASIVVTALYALSRQGSFSPERVTEAIHELDVDPEKVPAELA